MITLPDEPHLEPLTDGKNWRLLDDYAFEDVVVLKDFITDLASVPRIFWSILPPFGKYDGAAIVHDWGYTLRLKPRKEIDDQLLRGMVVCGVGWWSRNAIYWNVRAFGWIVWKNKTNGTKLAS